MMHGRENIKLINAEQAKPVHQYKDTKIKLYKNNAAIWYNKTCRTRQITQSALNRYSVQPPSRARIPDAVFVQLFLLKMGMSRPETCRG